jgi:hypothetical protein
VKRVAVSPENTIEFDSRGNFDPRGGRCEQLELRADGTL